MGRLELTSIDRVRAAIAALMLGRLPPNQLGAISLHPHQADAVARLARKLEEHRVALLADDVGLGKTYVALALAREAVQPLILAPAALRTTWLAALDRTGMTASFISIESLAHGVPQATPDFVIVDEAHHLRNASTRRFASAATLCSSPRVLLLSATPVQNRLDDLRALLSLVIGERAYGLAAEALATYCIRRDASALPAGLLGLPLVEEPRWLPQVEDVECLERLVNLPPPVPPADGGTGGVLLTYTLVRQWASSRAALRGALKRRVARALALEDALTAGRIPSRRELASWSCFGEAQQLAFPELVVQSLAGRPGELLAQVQEHCDAVRALSSWLEATADPDLRRAEAIRDVLRRHPDERVVAFSEYADTVARLYALLFRQTRCAMLTHHGGRVAGGPITRRDVLARFDPDMVQRIPDHERVQLLLTTDVLSEGVSLHAGSVVVHLDLAWNPARLAQRVGRLRRIGASRASVRVYAAPPPASAERLLRLDQLLRAKMAEADRAVGAAGPVLPNVSRVAPNASPVASDQRLAEALSGWRSDDPPDAPVAAVVRHPQLQGMALVAVRIEGAVALLAVNAAACAVSDDPALLHRLIDAASHSPEAAVGDVGDVVHVTEAWCRARAAASVVSVPALHVAHARRAILRRLDAIGRHAPRARQSQLQPLLRAARVTASAALPVAAESRLAKLATAGMPDGEWLTAIGALGHPPSCDASEVLAVLLFAR